MTPVTIITSLGKQRIECPSCWAEVKTKQYIEIIKEWDDGTDIADRDYFKLLNILTSDKFTGFENSIENQISLTSLVGWVIAEPFEFTEMPKVLMFHGKPFDIPQPSEMSIGQNIHLRRDYIDKSKKLEESIAIATAIYLQPIIDNSLFKIKRAEEIAKEIEEMPINLIYPIGFFLLESAQQFGAMPIKTSNLPRINLKQIFGQMFHTWRKSIH